MIVKAPYRLTKPAFEVLESVAKGEPVPRRQAVFFAFSDIAAAGLIRPNRDRTKWKITPAGESVLVAERRRRMGGT